MRLYTDEAELFLVEVAHVGRVEHDDLRHITKGAKMLEPIDG